MIHVHVIRADSVNDCHLMAEEEIQSLISSFTSVFYNVKVRKLSCPFDMECDVGFQRKPYMAIDIVRNNNTFSSTHLYYMEVPKHDEKSVDVSRKSGNRKSE